MNKKSLSQKERLELRGELSKDYIDSTIIENGYNSLNSIQQDYLNELAKLTTSDDILNYCKEIKSIHFKRTCESEILKGFVASNGHFYRTNRDDQTNLMGQKDLLSENPSIETVMWKTEDVGYIEHTKEEWIKIYNEAFLHKQTQLFKYDNLKKQVLLCATHEELDIINWDN